MSIIEKLQWRYATKKFDSTKILSPEKLQILKEAFNLTALSYGLQTLRLVVVSDKKTKEELLAFSYGQRQVADASHVLVLCIQNDIDKTVVTDYFESVKTIRQTPDSVLEPFKNQVITVVEGMSDASKSEWASKQAYIALGNLMTVCAAEGIDSCPMEGFIPNKLDDYLGLPSRGLKSVLLLPVGFRAKDDLFAQLKKVRKSIYETVIEL